MSAITILVADDDGEVRDFVAKTLRLKGYEVIEAADGLEGLELAAQHPDPIDLLLTDVCMPRMQGPELCRRMRAMFPETRMVVMSAYSDLELDPSLAFLAKPFSVQDLLATLSRVLEAVRAD